MLPVLLFYTSLIPEFHVPMDNHSYPYPVPFFLRAHRDEALVAGDAEDRVVRARPAGGRVDEQVHVLKKRVDQMGSRRADLIDSRRQPDLDLHLIDDERRGGLGKHDVELRGLKHGLRRVEGKAGELGLDEVRAVLPPRLNRFELFG